MSCLLVGSNFCQTKLWIVFLFTAITPGFCKYFEDFSFAQKCTWGIFQIMTSLNFDSRSGYRVTLS